MLEANLSRFKGFSINQKYGVLWLLAFLYSLGFGLTVQFIILPYIIPSLHGGHGLLINSDSIAFHNHAVIWAENIQRLGWSHWRLSINHENLRPSGLASIIYAITTTKPYVLLPFNAFFHATAFLIICRLTMAVIKEFWPSVISGIPFLVFPSSSVWVTQIHKDGLFILGIYLFFYAFYKLIYNRKNALTKKSGLCFVLAGLCMWSIRPYGLQFLLMFTVCILIGWTTSKILSKGFKDRASVVTFCFLLSLIIIYSLLGKSKTGIYFSSEEEIQETAEASSFTTINNEKAPDYFYVIRLYWRDSNIVPPIIEKVFYKLSEIRDNYINQHYLAHSSIDIELRFRSVWEMLAYIPRSLQIGFFTPFPDKWFFFSSQEEDRSMLKLLSTIETIFIYLCVPGLVLAFVYWNNRIELWSFFIFCVMTLVLYTWTIPNVGTLYRMRYSFLLVLVAYSIVGYYQFLKLRKK